MMMKKIMHILFLSCLKATELIEKQFHFKLSVTDRLRLKVHKMMCQACTNYEIQSIVIEAGIKNHLRRNLDSTDVTQLKEQIVQKLNHKESN
jgi:hypothetical protein